MRLCDNEDMRTTVDLTNDAYQIAKAMAEQQKISLGKAISELIIRPKRESSNLVREGRFLSYEGKRVLTPELAKELDDEY